MASDARIAAAFARFHLCTLRFNGDVFSQAFQRETAGVTFAVNSKYAVFSLSRDMVQCFFDIPFVDAARLLGISVSTLRHIRDWAGHDCWPFKSIVEGRFEMKREEITSKRLSFIQLLAGSDDVRYPMFLEAERLSPIFKSITTPTVYAYSSRVKVMLLNPVKSGQLPSRSATAVHKSKETFKRRFATKKMECLELAACETVVKDETPVEKVVEERPPLCPLSYVNDCVTPKWMEPEYPPVSEITDGVGAAWPVMEDPRRFVLHDLLYPRFKSRAVGQPFASLAGSAPLNVIESRMADGFLKEEPDSD